MAAHEGRRAGPGVPRLTLTLLALMTGLLGAVFAGTPAYAAEPSVAPVASVASVAPVASVASATSTCEDDDGDDDGYWSCDPHGDDGDDGHED